MKHIGEKETNKRIKMIYNMIRLCLYTSIHVEFSKNKNNTKDA